MTSFSTSSKSLAVVVVKCMLLIPIAFAALIGNVLVLLAIYRNQRLRSTTHYFIATLAVIDLMSACICQPLTASSLASGRWLTGTLGCDIQGFFNSFLTYTSSCTMVLTAVNRYYRVIKPQIYKRRFSRNRVIFLILSMLLFTFCIVLLPVLSGWGRFEFSNIFSACILQFPQGNLATAWAGFEFVVFSLIPLVIIAICYYKVSKTIRHHNQNVLASLQGNDSNVLSINVEEIKITKTLFGLVFAFFACVFIGFILVVVCRVVTGSILGPVGFTVSFLISLTAAINPVLYASTGQDFRREFILILNCKAPNSEVAPANFVLSR